MGKLGHKPIKKRGHKLYYLSPFRDEKEPSFEVDTKENIWNDYGQSEKGAKIIDLVTRLYSCSVSEALNRIENLCGKSYASSSSYTPNQLPLKPAIGNTGAEAPEYQINKVQALQNTALISYLESRKINISLAKRFLEEIYYTTRTGKRFFALAFKNNSGGYEVRNQYFKGSLLSKDMTTIPLNSASSSVLIFEGFMDFLSYLTHAGKENLDRIHSVIVLSSISMRDKALAEVKKSGCKQVFLLLDNDTNGKKTAQYFKDELVSVKVEDKSGIYDGFKDYNEYLTVQDV